MAAHSTADAATGAPGSITAFVEANAMGATQIMGYASGAGVEWAALSDGNEWQTSNSRAAVPLEEKLFRCRAHPCRRR